MPTVNFKRVGWVISGIKHLEYSFEDNSSTTKSSVSVKFSSKSPATTTALDPGIRLVTMVSSSAMKFCLQPRGGRYTPTMLF